MSVAGYNVDPESDDSVISIDLEEVNEMLAGKACICIGEGYSQTEIHLDYYELCAFIGQARSIRTEMEWNRATYIYASQGIAGDTQHLIVKGNAELSRSAFTIEPTCCKFEHTLCGRPAPVWTHTKEPRGWDIEPVLSDDPCFDKICKRCYAKWQKLQHQEQATA